MFLILLAGVLLKSGKPYETHPGCCQNKLLIISDVSPKSVPSQSVFCFVAVPLGFIQDLPRGKEAHIVHATSHIARGERTVGNAQGVRVRARPPLKVMGDVYDSPISTMSLGV